MTKKKKGKRPLNNDVTIRIRLPKVLRNKTRAAARRYFKGNMSEFIRHCLENYQALPWDLDE